jgi:methionyl-tRNA formyltransferase
VRIVFMGTPDFAVSPLKALLAAGHEVAGVFTQPDQPKGRGGRVQMSPVKELALSCGIPVYQPVKIRLDGLEPLRALKPELCVTAAFGQILSEDVLAVPKYGTVNVHASLLPRHRGPAPVQWALLMGDQETGITTMLTDKGIDTGDLLLRAVTPIREEDTAGSLLIRLSAIGAELLTETITRIAHGDCPRERQSEEGVTYEPKLSKELGALDFSQPTRQSLRRVRAMDPWPGAYADLANGTLKVWRAAAVETPVSAEPGTVLWAEARRGLAIATGDGALELTEIQAPNARRMEACEFLRGHSIPAGQPLKEVTI